MKLLNLAYIFTLGISLLANGAHASLAKLEKYLSYHNSSNPTEIRFDKWYQLSVLINHGNDVAQLLEVAEREQVNIVVETYPHRLLGSYRYLTRAKTVRHQNNTVLVYNWRYGLNYEDHPKSGEFHRAYGEKSVSLMHSEYREFGDVMIMIPSGDEYQIDLFKDIDAESVTELLSSLQKPRWR